MVVLSDVDKRILYELGVDARQSYKSLARNIGSKKEVVAYRINQLLKKGVIKKFVPVFSLYKLNIFASKIYLRLHGLSKESEEELYDYLLNNPHIVWVAKCVGHWDLLLGMYTKNIVDFARKKHEILSRFSEYIMGYDITQLEDGLVFNRDYLINRDLSYRKEFTFGGEVDKLELSSIDLNILKEIKDNARFQVVELGKKFGLDSRTVLRKIKGFEKNGLIQGYTVFIDLNKIGMRLNKLCIYLSKYDDEDINRLISFIKFHPNTIHLIKSLGSWELEVETEN